MCIDDFLSIKSFEFFKSHFWLTGWVELKSLAIRFQRFFPNILENLYDREKFLFRYTNTQRTEASYKAFVEGIEFDFTINK